MEHVAILTDILNISSDDVMRLQGMGIVMYEDRLRQLLEEQGYETCWDWSHELEFGEKMGQWYDTFSISPSYIPMIVAVRIAGDIMRSRLCVCQKCTHDREDVYSVATSPLSDDDDEEEPDGEPDAEPRLQNWPQFSDELLVG